jgi:hypothetical protein
MILKEKYRICGGVRRVGKIGLFEGQEKYFRGER